MFCDDGKRWKADEFEKSNIWKVLGGTLGDAYYGQFQHAKELCFYFFVLRC